jgi:hypothetical protein
MLERFAFDLKTTEGATNHGAIKLALKIVIPRDAPHAPHSTTSGVKSAIERNGGALPAGSITSIGRESHEEVSIRRPHGLMSFNRGVCSKRAVASPSSARAGGADRRAIFGNHAERARAGRGHAQRERMRARSSRSRLGRRRRSSRLFLRHAEQLLTHRRAARRRAAISVMGVRSRRFDRRVLARRQARYVVHEVRNRR